MSLTPAWQHAVEQYAEHQVLVDDVTETTAKLRRGQLRHLARTIGVGDPWAVSAEQLAAWTSTRGWGSRDTRRSYRTTLRGFYGWAQRAGYVATSPATELRRVRPEQPRPRPVPDHVYRAALAGTPARERLAMRLAAECGLRACEVAVVHTSDLVVDLVGTSLLVHGKGRKERLVPLPSGVARELRAIAPGWVFPGRVGGHLSAKWVSRLINRELPAGWTMHKLRHRAGTRVYEASGNDIRLAAAFLGHSDTKTTMVYVQANAARMRAAVERAA